MANKKSKQSDDIWGPNWVNGAFFKSSIVLPDRCERPLKYWSIIFDILPLLTDDVIVTLFVTSSFWNAFTLFLWQGVIHKPRGQFWDIFDPLPLRGHSY